MTSISDVIQELSYTTPLGGLASYTSEKYISGSYISLIITVYSDTNTRLNCQFSNDGTNWDSNVYQSFSGLTKEYANIIVIGKWIRITIENLDLAAQTVLRVYTYGAHSNSISNAIISKIGNLSPEVSVDNIPKTIFGETQVAEFSPKVQYIFNRGTDGNIYPQTFAIRYTCIKTYSSDNSGTVNFNGGNMWFGTLASTTAGTYQTLSGDFYNYRAGQGITARFTLCFEQGAKNALGNVPRTQFGGIGNLTSTNSLNNGMGFGFSNTGDWNNDTYDNFGIHYWNNGTQTFVPRNAWNVDKADGTFKLPALDFSKFQLYQVSFAYLGYGAMKWYIYSPSSYKFELVHVINRVNTYINTGPTNFSEPSLTLLLYQKIDAGCIPLSGSERISIGSFMLALEGLIYPPTEINAFNNNAVAVSGGVETPIIVLRNLSGNWYSRWNNIPIDLVNLSISCDGTKNTTVNVYFGGTITGGAWSSPYLTNQPVEFNTTGTYTVIGKLMLSYQLGKADQAQIDLNQIHIHLNPGDMVVITALSTSNTSVYASVSTNIH